MSWSTTRSPVVNFQDKKTWWRCGYCWRQFETMDECDDHFVHDHNPSPFCEECRRRP